MSDTADRLMRLAERHRRRQRTRHWFGLHEWVSIRLDTGARFTQCVFCGLVFSDPSKPYPFWVRHPWLWHAMFDGTRLCACQRSKEMRDCP